MTDSFDLDKITNLIMNHYHEGHAKHNYKYYDEALHDEWKFFMHDQNGSLKIVDKAKYNSWYDPKDIDDNLHWDTEIISIDTTGKVGSSKIRLECEKVRYIDYFNLMKLDEKWWIVHKVSHGTYK